MEIRAAVASGAGDPPGISRGGCIAQASRAGTRRGGAGAAGAAGLLPSRVPAST